MKIIGIKMIAVLCILLSISCCTKNRQHKDLSDLIGKSVVFPQNLPCYRLGIETCSSECTEMLNAKNKILIYVDSTGCSSCRLRLSLWKVLIEDAKKTFDNEVRFLFYFQPALNSNLVYIFDGENFDYPVFIDINNQFGKQNKLPKMKSSLCLLLDATNKVILTDNPVINPQVWQLYKEIINEKK